MIDGQKVNIPKPRKTIGDIVTMPIKAAAYPFREADPKVLAGRALTPSIAGKSAAQKLDAVKSVERNTKELYKKVRTGEFT